MYLEEVKARAIELQRVAPDAFVPCTAEEVAKIERAVGSPLPDAYKEFLLWSGHGFYPFRGSDYVYEVLPSLRVAAEELLQEMEFPGKLPEDAFVFLMHQGYLFNFFHLLEDEDPAVYYYQEHMEQFEMSFAHLSDFLMEVVNGSVESLSNRIALVATMIREHPTMLTRDSYVITQVTEFAHYDEAFLGTVADIVYENPDVKRYLCDLAHSNYEVAVLMKRIKRKKADNVKSTGRLPNWLFRSRKNK